MPTANLALEDLNEELKYGVYACRVYIDEREYIGVCNVGNRPTVDDKTAIEVHILDFDEDIYGKQIGIEFCDYLRPITRFNTLEEVKKQVDTDILKTRELLSA